MKVNLSNDAGVVKQVKVGFSWTTFFFAFFPALFRGDLKWAAIMFIAAIGVGVVTLGFGSWIPALVFSFIYNKLYIKDLLEKGYYPADDTAQKLLTSKGIILPSTAA